MADVGVRGVDVIPHYLPGGPQPNILRDFFGGLPGLLLWAVQQSGVEVGAHTDGPAQ
jgi:hypothetical protein